GGGGGGRRAARGGGWWRPAGGGGGGRRGRAGSRRIRWRRIWRRTGAGTEATPTRAELRVQASPSPTPTRARGCPATRTWREGPHTASWTLVLCARRSGGSGSRNWRSSRGDHVAELRSFIFLTRLQPQTMRYPATASAAARR